MDNPAVLVAHRLEDVRRDFPRLTFQKRIVRGIYFNSKIFWKEECLKLSRFQQKELCTMGKVVTWRALTERLWYCSSSIMAICIVTGLQADFRPRWVGSNWNSFPRRHLKPCERNIGSFFMTVHPCTTLLGSLQMKILQNRAHMYADCISESTALLTNCLRFIDGTKNSCHALTDPIRASNHAQRTQTSPIAVFISRWQCLMVWFFIFTSQKLGGVTTWPCIHVALWTTLRNRIQ